MVAPSIIAAEAPWNGQTFFSLVEEVLRERGLTYSAAPDTDATLTAASTAQIAQAKKCVMRALDFLQEQRSQWWSMSEDDTVAASPYTRAILPTDFSTFGRGGAFIGGVRLQMLNPEQYAANVRKTSEGGGILCAEIAGDPTHGRLVMVQNTETSVVYYRYALEVYPVQAAAWTAHILYNASAKNLTTDIVVRIPVKLQTVLADLCRAEWRKMTGDAKGASEFLALAHAALDDINETPGEQMPMLAQSRLPYENTPR